MPTLIMLLAVGFLFPSVALAQDRLYVYQEGFVRSDMRLVAPCPESGEYMEKRINARSSAIAKGFLSGQCLKEINDMNFNEMSVAYTVGHPVVYYLTSEELEAFRKYADERGAVLVASESMPPEE